LSTAEVAFASFSGGAETLGMVMTIVLPSAIVCVTLKVVEAIEAIEATSAAKGATQNA